MSHPASALTGNDLPVLVISAGYDSCPASARASESDLAIRALRWRQIFAWQLGIPQDAIPWIASCYLKINRWESTLQVESSHPIRGTTFADQISQLAGGSGRTPHLIFIGHSWGGMLAIDSASPVRAQLAYWSQIAGYEHLRDTKQLLISIDPIDYQFCQPPPIRNIGNNDCRSAPRRLSFNNWELLSQVYASVERWMNIYQTDAPWLHSGPVINPSYPSAAYMNAWQHYDSGDNPHIRIIQDQRTWDLITQQASYFLGAGAPVSAANH